ncbi:zinc-binding dehydrogenase [Neobacillus sp.]|uniref:zinc-binding dehydrogenase n=1 Tax=Neobacillus sp. TaxID=2675273 RepID=UPI00289AC15B|nr:zinc-binding dehydrogenase [Neobacillus sp.]
MKALAKKKQGYGNMDIIEIEKPEPTGNLVRIKVAYAGICGTDIHCFKGEYDRMIPPLVLGHEFSGIVDAIGEMVTKVKPGDRVTSETTLWTCGECESCRNKEYNLCRNRKGLGSQVDGCFAQYVLVREEGVHKLADNISLLAASITEPIACGVHASMEKSDVQSGDTVVILGPGPIGLCLAQVLKSMDVTVILAGITKDKKRLELAKKLGVDFTVDTQKEDLTSIVDEWTNGKGVDIVFECSGVAAVLNNIFDLLKQKGQLIQMGVFSKRENMLALNEIVQREFNITGSRSQKPSSWIKTLELMRTGKIEPEKLITRIESLDNWESAFEAAMEGSEIKVVLQPNVLDVE